MKQLVLLSTSKSYSNNFKHKKKKRLRLIKKITIYQTNYSFYAFYLDQNTCWNFVSRINTLIPLYLSWLWLSRISIRLKIIFPVTVLFPFILYKHSLLPFIYNERTCQNMHTYKNGLKHNTFISNKGLFSLYIYIPRFLNVSLMFESFIVFLI